MKDRHLHQQDFVLPAIGLSAGAAAEFAMTPDMINGMFECMGGILLLLNVRAIKHHKMIRGISVWPAMFFASWGLWNLYYYPHLNQWYSFSGGIVVVTANIAWLALIWRYRKR